MSDCEELSEGYSQEMMGVLGHKSSASTERYSHLSGEETLETRATISRGCMDKMILNAYNLGSFTPLVLAIPRVVMVREGGHETEVQM